MNGNAKIPAGTVEVTTRDGEFRLHSSGCRDLAREERYATETLVLDAQHVGTYAGDLFGDVASDRYAYGTDEWAEAVAREFDAQVTILPCVHLA